MNINIAVRCTLINWRFY